MALSHQAGPFVYKCTELGIKCIAQPIAHEVHAWHDEQHERQMRQESNVRESSSTKVGIVELRQA